MLEIALVGLVVLAVALVVACRRDDRAKAFEAAAPGLGMHFLEDLPEESAEAIRSLPSFARRTRNFFPRVLASPDVIVFDWVWVDDRLKDRNRESQTVFALREAGADLPRFLLAEKDAITKGDEQAAGSLVQFTTPPEWNDRFALHGEAKSALRELFPADVRSSFRLPSDVRIEGGGEWVVVYRPGRTVVPATVQWELGDVRALLAEWRGAQ